jgi:Tfp pilus assembly protein PilF
VIAAIASLQRATAIDPLLQQSWLLLARIYLKTGKPNLRNQTLKEFLSRMPQNLAVRAALGQE